MAYPTAGRPGAGFRFGLLGPLLVTDVTGQVAVLPAAKQRVILAALLLSANTEVSADRLTEILWGVSPPPSAATAVRNYVMRLRRQMGLAGSRIVTRPTGYTVEVQGPAELDVAEVDCLRRDARAAAQAGRWPEVSELLSVALGLWRGDPLADVPSPAFTQQVAHLTELRLQITEIRIDADLRLARHDELVAELRQLAAEYPLREHPRVQLMLAFYRCGRQAEALEVYRNTRATLMDEIGVEPASELREMHQRILAGDPGLLVIEPSRRADQVPAAAATGEKERVIPRQLPAGTRHFTGRIPELRALDALVNGAADTAGTVVISAIAGMAGVGKTALALRWAHQAASQFPDGQLYVNLRGFDPTGRPVPAAAAIRGFLDALGVAAEQIPADLDAQASLYRSLLSGKRMLILLDNARDSEQVRPLLPGSSSCLVVVTSRSQLAGLVTAAGAHPLTVDVLTEVEARELLALLLGADRLGAQPEAAAALIGLCARLPLALAIAGARASARPRFGLGALVEQLQDVQRRLDALETGDTSASLRAVFSWSLASLPAPAARMFGLLGLHPGPDITTPAAASLAGVSLPQARLALSQLAEAHLITEHAPGRFSLHDLLRAYAAEQACAAGSDTAPGEAVGRVLDHYLHTAHAAALLLNPSRDPLTLDLPRPGVSPEHLADHLQAMTWFEAEHHVITSAVTLAAQRGLDAYGWQLPWTIANFLDWRGHWHEWAAVQRAALAAAIRLGDTTGQAAAHRLLAHSCAKLADYDQARAHLTDCLRLYQQLGDLVGLAHVHQTLCWLSAQQGRTADTLGHAEQALVLFQATGNQPGQAEALNNVGCSYALLGDYRQAQTSCQQALSLHSKLGDRPGEASSWDSLGYAEHQLRNFTDAADCYGHALSIFRELGNRYCQADTLTHLGDTHHAAGEENKAQDAWRQALAILDELHHPDAAKLRVKLRAGKVL
jgi:DNA-binding SARP family transcriptional activator